jgi:hypothetical protein
MSRKRQGDAKQRTTEIDQRVDLKIAHLLCPSLLCGTPMPLHSHHNAHRMWIVNTVLP